MEMTRRVRARMGRMALPIVSAKYLAKIPNRERVQDIGSAQIFLSKWQRLEQLKALAKAYAEYEPYKKIHDEGRVKEPVIRESVTTLPLQR